MSKNKLLLGLIISGTLLILSVIIWYWLLISKADLLKDHYPVFNNESKAYELVDKKPDFWVSYKDVSKELKFAIMISEDWAFFDHEGIDTQQIQKALEESLSEGKLVRGASTITQQVVKNAFLSNERSLFRKLKEVLIAKQLENVLTKEQILEVYLNLIELGKGIYGVKKGSEFYFKKHPREINAKEGAFMAMLLPSPRKYSQSFDKKELTQFADKQINSILKKMKIARVINEEQLDYYKNLKLSFEKGMQEENILANDYYEEELIIDQLEQDIFEADKPEIVEEEKPMDAEAYNQEMDDKAKEFAPKDELDLEEDVKEEY